MIVIGGGITGAGILREAARLGLRALLVEQRDFAWGTSSRSSKLVHGGLRYLKEGQMRLTRASVRERERLLHEGPGLIDPLGFLLAIYRAIVPGRWTYGSRADRLRPAGLQLEPPAITTPKDFQMLAPHVAPEGLQGRVPLRRCPDRRRPPGAARDPARRLPTAARRSTMCSAEALLRTAAAGVRRVRHCVSGAACTTGADRSCDVHARLVINATGAWADRLRGEAGRRRRASGRCAAAT